MQPGTPAEVYDTPGVLIPDPLEVDLNYIEAFDVGWVWQSFPSQSAADYSGRDDTLHWITALAHIDIPSAYTEGISVGMVNGTPGRGSTSSRPSSSSSPTPTPTGRRPLSLTSSGTSSAPDTHPPARMTAIQPCLLGSARRGGHLTSVDISRGTESTPGWGPEAASARFRS